MSSLHEPRLRAEPLLELALGLRGTIARLDALLERYAPGDVDDPSPPSEAEAWMLVVLGAIALRDRVDAALAAPGDGDVVAAASPALAGLLR